jgi:hypothetical protein
MLQAMNTGHDGSLTTLHANTPRDALARLETLVLMAGFDLPVRAIREQIASAVDAVVQIERLRDGTRKVTSITEVVGMEGDIVTMQELIRYQQKGVDKDNKVLGEFQYTGVQPHYAPRFEEAGVHFDVRNSRSCNRQVRYGSIGFYPYAIGASVCGILALLFYASGIEVGGFHRQDRHRLPRAGSTAPT